MPYSDEYFPEWRRGVFFPDEETFDRFISDRNAGLCDPDELAKWEAWPFDPPPKAPSATASSKLESVAEAAKRKGVSKKRIRQWVSDRKLKCVRFDDRINAEMNIVADDLDRLIDELAAWDCRRIGTVDASRL